MSAISEYSYRYGPFCPVSDVQSMMGYKCAMCSYCSSCCYYYLFIFTRRKPLVAQNLQSEL